MFGPIFGYIGFGPPNCWYMTASRNEKAYGYEHYHEKQKEIPKMSEMIERVAKAIDTFIDRDGCLFDRKAAVKAAIEAMRDLVKCDPEGNKYDSDVFNIYIDKALKE